MEGSKRQKVEVHCRCGSRTHGRVTHRDCRFNPRNLPGVKPEPGQLKHRPPSKADKDQLLASYDFELAQGLKGRLFGLRMRQLIFRHQYQDAIPLSELYARSIRLFGSRKQQIQLAYEQALAVVARLHNLPWLVIKIIRAHIHGHENPRFDPSAFEKLKIDDKKFGHTAEARKRCRDELKVYLRAPEAYMKSIRAAPALRVTLPALDGDDTFCSRLVAAIQSIEGDDGPAREAVRTKVMAALGIAAVDTTKPHTLTVRVDETSQFSTCHLGVLRLPSNGCASLLAAHVDALLPKHGGPGGGFWAAVLPPPGETYAEGHGDATLEVVDNPATVARQSVLGFRSEREIRLAPRVEAHAAVIAQLDALDAARPTRVTVKVSKIGRDKQRLDATSLEPLNPNGGDDTAIVTNVLSTTHSTWVVDPAVHPATGPQPPTYRKKVHGSRAALCRHIAEQTFVPRYEQTFVPRYDPKPGEVEIVTSCSIADVLPTMEESMQPSETPIAAVRSPGSKHGVRVDPKVKAHLDFEKYNHPIRLTVISRTALLPESECPAKVEKLSFRDLTPSW